MTTSEITTSAYTWAYSIDIVPPDSGLAGMVVVQTKNIITKLDVAVVISPATSLIPVVWMSIGT